MCQHSSMYHQNPPLVIVAQGAPGHLATSKTSKRLLTDARNRLVVLETQHIYSGYYPGRVNAEFPAGSTKANPKEAPMITTPRQSDWQEKRQGVATEVKGSKIIPPSM